MRPLALFGLLLTTLLGAQATRSETSPSLGELRRLEPLEHPEVLSLWPAAEGAHVAAVTSCGAVWFCDAKTGKIERVVLTLAEGWQRRIPPNPGKGTPAITLRGIPVAIDGVDLIAVVNQTLLRIDPDGRRRQLCENEVLAGATLVRVLGPDGPVLVGTRPGAICRVASDGVVTLAPSPLEESILAMAVAPNRAFFLSAGEGPYWHVRDCPTMLLTENAGNYIGEELFHAMEISPDSRVLAVSHGYSTRIKAFDLAEDGKVASHRGAWKGPRREDVLAFDSTGRLIATGDLTGAVRVFSSFAGDVSDLPRSTRLPAESSGSGKILAELGSWREDEEPIRGVRFLERDALIISVTVAGTLVGRDWPAGTVRWKTKLPSLCPSGDNIRIAPRTFSFGKVRMGDKTTRTVEVLKEGAPKLALRDVSVEPAGVFTVKVEEETPGAIFRLVIGLSGGEGKTGYVRGTLTFKTSATLDDVHSAYFYAMIE